MFSHGKEVVGKLLVDLQVRKSTADGPGARKFYTQLTTPLPGWDNDIRNAVLKKKTVGPISSHRDSSLEANRCLFLLAPEAICSTEHFLTGR